MAKAEHNNLLKYTGSAALICQRKLILGYVFVTFLVQYTCILNSKLHKLLIQIGLKGFINLFSLISIVILLA